MWGVYGVELTAIDCVDGRESNEHGEIALGMVDAVNAESGIIRNCHSVFTAVDKMREYVSSIVVTTKTLQCAPYAG